jgi:hypothetical protein
VGTGAAGAAPPRGRGDVAREAAKLECGVALEVGPQQTQAVGAGQSPRRVDELGEVLYAVRVAQAAARHDAVQVEQVKGPARLALDRQHVLGRAVVVIDPERVEPSQPAAYGSQQAPLRGDLRRHRLLRETLAEQPTERERPLDEARHEVARPVPLDDGHRRRGRDAVRGEVLG